MYDAFASPESSPSVTPQHLASQSLCMDTAGAGSSHNAPPFESRGGQLVQGSRNNTPADLPALGTASTAACTSALSCSASSASHVSHWRAPHARQWESPPSAAPSPVSRMASSYAIPEGAADGKQAESLQVQPTTLFMDVDDGPALEHAKPAIKRHRKVTMAKDKNKVEDKIKVRKLRNCLSLAH